jgi:hypothetical protein
MWLLPPGRLLEPGTSAKDEIFYVHDNRGRRFISVKGRHEMALKALMLAKENGVSGAEADRRGGPRWRAYVHPLRHRYGIEIETIPSTSAGEL